MSRSKIQTWCTVIAYTLGALAVLGVLLIVIRTAVVSS
jgi:hypothetical protein